MRNFLVVPLLHSVSYMSLRLYTYIMLYYTHTLTLSLSLSIYIFFLLALQPIVGLYFAAL